MNNSHKSFYNIDPENLLWLPGKVHVYWKSLGGNYLGCNDLMAENASLSSRHAIRDRSDYDFAAIKNEATKWRKDDSEVTSLGHAKHFHNKVTLKKIILHTLDLKMPLKNASNQVCGILGISYIVNANSDADKFEQSLSHSLEQLQASFFNVAKIKLSRRQMECLYYLLQGKSAKEIGRTLNLSHRTIEAYMIDIKNKLNCQSKSDLIAKIHRILFMSCYSL